MLRHPLHLAVLAALAVPSAARAGGFIVGEIDSASAGRGNAAAALEGPAAVFFNPANIVNLKGVNASAGVSILLPHGVGYIHQPGMVFSPDGRCRAFDANANGMLSGSGSGAAAKGRAKSTAKASSAGVPVAPTKGTGWTKGCGGPGSTRKT